MSEVEIVRMRFGSHVYGTSTPTSDEDFKSVFVPTASDILLQRATKVSRNRSTGTPNGKNAAGDIDVEEFSLHGYLKLLCEGQTVAVDMLFVPDKHILHSTLVWDTIVSNRNRLISKSVAPFVGYCRAQANKYGIKGSRMAAAKAAAEVFESWAQSHSADQVGDYPILDIERLVSQHEHITIEELGPRKDKHISVCGKRAAFNLKIHHAAKMYSDLWERYGERSRRAMNNEGIDWKALMHARRICDQAIELLSTGAVTFPRPNAAGLLEIRLGNRKYHDVAKEIEDGMEEMEAAMASSKLQLKPDRGWAKECVENVYQHQVEQESWL